MSNGSDLVPEDDARSRRLIVQIDQLEHVHQLGIRIPERIAVAKQTILLTAIRDPVGILINPRRRLHCSDGGLSQTLHPQRPA